jgi:hypothetical protein
VIASIEDVSIEEGGSRCRLLDLVLDDDLDHNVDIDVDVDSIVDLAR